MRGRCEIMRDFVLFVNINCLISLQSQIIERYNKICQFTLAILCSVTIIS